MGYCSQRCQFLKDGEWTKLGLEQIGEKEEDNREVKGVKESLEHEFKGLRI